MQVGDKIKSFEFNATNNITAKLSDYRGQWLIIYFYPKDSTPGCTIESQDFRDAYPQFKALNTEIFGISRDNIKSHENFKCEENLPFDLITDNTESICKYFDVIKTKNMYGKEVQGIERSTFLIDPQGILRHEWRKVTVKGHVEEVLSTLKNLQAEVSG